MSLTPEQIAKPLKIAKRIQETPDAVSLVLEIPADLRTAFRYQAGQFVSFFLKIQGETISRSYSLSCSPLLDSEFKITVKKVSGGKGSTHLCEQVKAGDTLLTTPPAGHFFKPIMSDAHYLLFAAGSGITPVYSILKTVLETSKANRATLVYCNRNEESIIYRQELEEWVKRFEGRLEVVQTLTQPTSAWKGRTGRLNEALVQTVYDKAKTSGLAIDSYMCGPADFMNLIRTTLEKNQLPKERIHIEDFGTAVHKPAAGPKVNDSWTFIGPDDVKEQPEKIIAQINGETLEIAAKPGRNIVETLLEAGAQPPYSCLDGACMACLAKIQEGRVYQEDPGILTDDNVGNCEALTCQAKPLSRIVKLSYDNI